MDILFRKFIRSRKGSTSPVIICVVLIIILSAAFLADIGYAAFQRFSLYSTVKQAAVIGAEALLKSRKAAEEAVRFYTLKNAGDLSQLETTISDSCREITVYVKRPFEYFFVKYLGVEKKEITSKVTVRLSGVMSIKDVRPFGVIKSKLEPGGRYIISNTTAAANNSIRVVPLQLGNSKFADTVILGYPGKLTIGDSVEAVSTQLVPSVDVKEEIDTLIGNCRHNPECTFDNYKNNCTRIIIIPVLAGVDNKSLYKISGFAAFFLEECKIEGEYFYITGRFIKHAVRAEMSDSAENFGLAAIRVIDR